MTEHFPAIIIPAYQPNHRLINLVSELRAQGPNPEIIVVNDGSSSDKTHIFEQLKDYRVKLIEHNKNYGKGQALKTAFNYYLQETELPIGVITADADGQHLVKDILSISHFLKKSVDTLCLGVRNFSQNENITVPWRSRFGNKLTAYLFQIICSTYINDTQTGLRGIPGPLLKLVTDSPAKGYELEMEMLMLAAIHKIPISTIPIETVYFDNNSHSHFKPVSDSIKVYKVMAKYFFRSFF